MPTKTREFDLVEAQAKGLPRLEYTEILKLTGELSQDEESALRLYFSRFTFPTKGECPGCGTTLIADEIRQLLGMASFTWGIANGEGHCADCGYPARAFHRDVGPIKFMNVILPYHPDELRRAVAESDATEQLDSDHRER